MTAYEYLSSVLREIATAACMGAAYKDWNDSFAREEVREVWTDADAPLRRQRKRRVTADDIRAMSDNEKAFLGFARWDDSGLRLIPLWAFHYIADGETLTCISGVAAIKGVDEIDMDVRCGCIAYGIASKAGTP